MELQSFIIFQASYTTLKKLISAINIFATLQGYAIVKRRTKKSKKRVLRKAVLICNRNKIHIDERKFAIDITSRKSDCLFDMVVLIKDNV